MQFVVNFYLDDDQDFALLEELVVCGWCVVANRMVVLDVERCITLPKAIDSVMGASPTVGR